MSPFSEINLRDLLSKKSASNVPPKTRGDEERNRERQNFTQKLEAQVFSLFSSTTKWVEESIKSNTDIRTRSRSSQTTSSSANEQKSSASISARDKFDSTEPTSEDSNSRSETQEDFRTFSGFRSGRPSLSNQPKSLQPRASSSSTTCSRLLRDQSRAKSPVEASITGSGVDVDVDSKAATDTESEASISIHTKLIKDCRISTSGNTTDWPQFLAERVAEKPQDLSAPEDDEIVSSSRRSAASRSQSQVPPQVNSADRRTSWRSKYPNIATPSRSKAKSISLHASPVIDLIGDDSEDSLSSVSYGLDKPTKKTNRLRTPVTNQHPTSTRTKDSTLGESLRNAFRHCVLKLESAEDISSKYPRSLQLATTLPLKPSNERKFLYEFIAAETRETKVRLEESDDFSEIPLSCFSIYRSIDESRFPGQLESLHNVALEQAENKFFFDGVVSNGVEDTYLESIPVRAVSIGGCEPHIHTTNKHIWLQSEECADFEGAWYALQTPAPEYEDLWTKSLWLADLAKHFFDYLDANQTHRVVLNDFHSDFIRWLQGNHGDDREFRQWHDACGNRTDFRQDIAIYQKFLWHQVYNISARLGSHPLWLQISPRLDTNSGPVANEQSVVTSNVGKSFLVAFDHWGREKTNGRPGLDLLEIVNPCHEVLVYQQRRREKLQFSDKYRVDQAGFFERIDGNLVSKADLTLQNAAHQSLPTSVPLVALFGKLVVVKTLRPKQKDFEYKYALARGTSRSGSRLEVVWVLKPSETTCGGGHYPIGNEVFLSDGCNCDEVHTSNVVSAFNVSLLTDCAQEDDEFFVRELFTNCGMFVSATQKDLDYRCACTARQAGRESANPAKAKLRADHTRKVEDVSKMKVLSLFSGCGLLDRGLESSRVCQTVSANDLNTHAIQSHAANQTNAECKYVSGSVNICLLRLLRGKDPLNHVDCVAAGCPCVGFSLRNQDRSAKSSQRNCSLLATTLSFVELYLPSYLVLENVTEMDSYGKPTACQQAICVLVALGYQVQKWSLLASEHEAPQSRRRLFIIATAFGFEIPEKPVVKNGRQTLTKETSASRSTRHLERVDNDTIVNLKDPSHVPVCRLGWHSTDVSLRSIVRKIPRNPPGVNMFGAWKDKLLSQHESRWVEAQHEEKLRAGAGTLRRIKADQPFKTVLTSINVMDARHSGTIHWDEHRSPTLAELRIAMGIPEDMVLIGSMQQQLKQAGNGVPVQLASAVGKMVGAAWVASHCPNVEASPEKAHVQPTRHNFTLAAHESYTTRKRQETDPIEIETATETVVESVETEDLPQTSEQPTRVALNKRPAESLIDARAVKIRKESQVVDGDEDVVFMGARTITKEKPAPALRREESVDAPEYEVEDDDDDIKLPIRRSAGKSADSVFSKWAERSSQWPARGRR